MITDLFASDLVVALSDVLVVLVNQLTLEDQRYVRVLEKLGGPEKTMIVIHNLKEVTEIEDLESLIEKDVINGFGCIAKTWLGGETYWKRGTVAHAVIAKDRSPAGEKVNLNTIQFLKNFIQGEILRKETSRKNMVQGINDYIQTHVHKCFMDLPARTMVCGEFQSDQLKIFMDTTETHQVKKNALITEWQVIWGARYELDYSVLEWTDEKSQKGVIVQVDLPGVLKGKPSKAGPKQISKTYFLRVYEWREWQQEDFCVRLTVRIGKQGDAGPSVKVEANRPKCIQGEDHFTFDSGKHGRTELLVDLEKIRKEFDGFKDAVVKMEENGVLTVDLLQVGSNADGLMKWCAWCQG